MPKKINRMRGPIFAAIRGAKKLSRKFHSQFDAVASEAWRARVRVGNVSPIRIQIPLWVRDTSQCWGLHGQIAMGRWTYGAQVMA